MSSTIPGRGNGAAEREWTTCPLALAWLENAYAMAKHLGSIKPWPVDESGWLAKVEGIRLMHERLSALDGSHG